MSAKIELAIFDWDGVVSDSEPLQVEAEQVGAQAVAAELGTELDIAAIDWTEFQGWGRVKIAAALFGVEPSSELANDYRQRVVETTVEIMGEHNLQPVEGAVEFLSYMQRHVGDLAVATSSNRLILDPSMDLFGVRSRFGVDPSNVVIFEDSRSGITAARHSGALVVAIETTQTYEFLRGSTGAHEVAHDYPHAAHILQPLLR